MSDLFRLDNKVVAVIGAGSGIGEAVAIGAASQGAAAVCVPRRQRGWRARASRRRSSARGA